MYLHEGRDFQQEPCAFMKTFVLSSSPLNVKDNPGTFENDLALAKNNVVAKESLYQQDECTFHKNLLLA